MRCDAHRIDWLFIRNRMEIFFVFYQPGCSKVFVVCLLDTLAIGVYHSKAYYLKSILYFNRHCARSMADTHVHCSRLVGATLTSFTSRPCRVCASIAIFFLFVSFSAIYGRTLWPYSHRSSAHKYMYHSAKMLAGARFFNL